MNADEITKNALAEVGYGATLLGNRLNVTWDTPPEVAYKAWVLGRMAKGDEVWDFEEWVAKCVDPEFSNTPDVNYQWLRSHGIDVEGIIR